MTKTVPKNSDEKDEFSFEYIFFSCSLGPMLYKCCPMLYKCLVLRCVNRVYHWSFKTSVDSLRKRRDSAPDAGASAAGAAAAVAGAFAIAACGEEPPPKRQR